MTEIWQPIPGWEGYYSINSLGQVRSEHRRLIRRNGSPYKVQARVMRQTGDKRRGPRYVKLARYGEYTTVWPHLVARELFGDQEHAG
jgi:hypothetical protein